MIRIGRKYDRVLVVIQLCANSGLVDQTRRLSWPCGSAIQLSGRVVMMDRERVDIALSWY